jgi:hypothetical protein
MNQPKRCPFCGWGTIVDVGGFVSHAAGCNSRGARTAKYKTWEEAVKAWNRRESDTELETLRSENAMLFRQRDPRHRSELEDVEIADTAREVEQTARANMAKMLKME